MVAPSGPDLAGLKWRAATVDGLLDRFANPQVRGAPTQIPGHRGVDLRVGRLRCLREQRRGRHDLSGLAVAALRDVDLLPRALHGMRAVSRESLDRGDTRAPPTAETGVTHERTALPFRCTVHAPHCATPHPYFVPTRSSSSRSTHKRGVSGGTSTDVCFPLIFNSIGIASYPWW